MQLRPIASALLIAALSSTVLPGCDKVSNATPQELIERAKDLEDKGDLKGSIIELKNAIQRNPDSPQARFLLGQVYLKAGMGAEAEKELAQAEKLGVKSESVKLLLGKAWLLQGEYKRVLGEISLSDSASQQNKAALLQLRGDANVGLGQSDEGCQLYKESLALDPNQVASYGGLARCAGARGEFDEARAMLGKALKLDEKNSEIWVALGDIEQASGRLKEAEDTYGNAIKHGQQEIKGLLRRASLRLRTNNLDGAAADVAAARKIAPNNLLAKHAQAMLNFRQGKYAEARDGVQEVLRYAPDYAPSVLLAGAVAYAMGSYEQAAQYASKALSAFPNNVYARKVLAASLLQRGEAPRALDALKPLLGSETQDGAILALAGEAALQAKQYTKASQLLERAAANDTQNAGLRTALGVAHLAAGESGRGMAELEAAAELDPGQGSADTVLLLTHMRNGEWDKALAASEALEKKMPGNATVFNLRGMAFAGKKDYANARKSFEQALAVQPTSVAAALNLAQLDLRDKNPQAARKRYESVLEHDKSNEQAMLGLAKLAAAAKQEKEYVDWLEKAAKASPAAFQPRQLLVAYYMGKNEPQKALAIARESVSTAPNNPEVLDMLGAAQFAAGEKDSALTTYGKLVRLTPKSPVAHYKLASVQALMNKRAEAKASLAKALELQPDYLDAKVALIRLEVKAGNHGEALNIAQRLQTQHPKSSVGYVLEAEILATQAKYPAALKAYQKAMSVGPSGALAIKVHQFQTLTGDGKKAEADMLQWLKGQPNDLAARLYLAESYVRTGRDQDAIREYERVAEKTPNNVLALNNLAGLYQKVRDKRALPTAERAYKLEPDSPIVLDTLGSILLEQGDTARALKLLGNASTKAPNALEIRFRYAQALAKSGDKSKARQTLEELLASGKPFPQRDAAKALLKQL